MAGVCYCMSEINLAGFGVTGAYFGWVAYEPGGALGPRVQRDVQLVMLDSGSLVLELDGEERTIARGEVCVLWPGGRERFTFDRHRRSVHRWLTMSIDGGASTRAAIASWRSAWRFSVREPDELARLQRLGRRMQLAGYATDSTALRQLGLAYLAAFARVAAPSSADARPLPPAIASVLAMIAQRLAEPLTLDDLAEAASVSPPHLVRLFRRHLKTTPMRTLWDMRVDRGAELLRTTGLNVSQVAYQTGFTSPFHFSRLMKQRTGQSPTAWRQRQWARER